MRRKHKYPLFWPPVRVGVKTLDVAGLHWAISINVFIYNRWEFFLDRLAYMARSSAEMKTTWHGYHSCPVTHREWHLWGKIPWQQFKNMKWWFRPLFVIRRFR